MLPKLMQVRNFGKVSGDMLIGQSLADLSRCRGPSTPISPIKIPVKADGAPRQDRPEAPVSGTLERPPLDAGTVSAITNPQGLSADEGSQGGGPHLRKGKLRRDRGESHAHVPDCPNNNINDQNAFTGGTSSGMGISANTAALGSGGGSRGWGDRESRDREGGRYRDEGRERRFDEERQG
jgi:hypothetical protein